MKRLFILIALVMAFVLPTSALAIGLEIAVGGWMQSPTGEVEYDGDMVDLVDDLGLDKETRASARIKLDMPAFIPNIYLMVTPMEFNGSELVNFNFGGYNFTGQTKTHLVMDHIDFAMYYGIPLLEELSNEVLNIEFGLNVKVMNFEMRVEEVLSSTMESTSMTVAIPMLYGAIQIRPDDAIAFEAEGRGVSYSGNEVFDYIGRIKFYPFGGSLFVAGGYRGLKIKMDTNDVKGDMSFAGPFAEAGFKF